MAQKLIYAKRGEVSWMYGGEHAKSSIAFKGEYRILAIAPLRPG